jgi:ribosomal protein L1
MYLDFNFKNQMLISANKKMRTVINLPNFNKKEIRTCLFFDESQEQNSSRGDIM